LVYDSRFLVFDSRVLVSDSIGFWLTGFSFRLTGFGLRFTGFDFRMTGLVSDKWLDRCPSWLQKKHFDQFWRPASGAMTIICLETATRPNLITHCPHPARSLHQGACLAIAKWCCRGDVEAWFGSVLVLVCHCFRINFEARGSDPFWTHYWPQTTMSNSKFLARHVVWNLRHSGLIDGWVWAPSIRCKLCQHVNLKMKT
jgi:hypothetical protein